MPCLLSASKDFFRSLTSAYATGVFMTFGGPQAHGNSLTVAVR
jgi:hypothetical protein